MIESANAYHEEYDKGFLRWKMPDAAAAGPRPHPGLIRQAIRTG